MSFTIKSDGEANIIQPTGQALIVLHDLGDIQIGDAVILHSNGDVEFGPGYTTTDEVARQFWTALAMLRPDWARAKAESESQP